MSTGSIEFACPYCEKVTRVPAVYGGRQGKCPGCQKVIEVPLPPDAATAIGSAPTAYEPPPPPIGSPVGSPIGSPVGSPVGSPPGTPIGAPMGSPTRPADAGPAFEFKHGADAAAGDGAERPCPSCGESIKAAARKCKYCGEFLDEGLRAQRRGSGTPASVGRLASPWTRLAAAFLDNMLGGIPAGGLMVGGVLMFDRSGGPQPLGVLLIGVGFLYLLAYSIYNWYLIATRGQNLTKGWFGIKIVRIDGTPVDFVSGVILRNWVYQLIGMIPFYIGTCVQLVGVLMIFSEDRRCLHDHIASTVVVEV